MQNVDAEQFSFESFKAAYDTDPRIKPLIKNFDRSGIEPATQNELEGGDDDDAAVASDGDGDTVGQMAQRATDLGSDL